MIIVLSSINENFINKNKVIKLYKIAIVVINTNTNLTQKTLIDLNKNKICEKNGIKKYNPIKDIKNKIKYLNLLGHLNLGAKNSRRL